ISIYRLRSSLCKWVASTNVNLFNRHLFSIRESIKEKASFEIDWYCSKIPSASSLGRFFQSINSISLTSTRKSSELITSEGRICLLFIKLCRNVDLPLFEGPTSNTIPEYGNLISINDSPFL